MIAVPRLWFAIGLAIAIPTALAWWPMLITGGANDLAGRLLWEVRLPRILSGAAAGALLGLAGMLLQSVTRNPLADPGLIGIHGGAGLGVVTVVVTAKGAVLAPWIIPVAAVAGAYAAAGVVLLVAVIGGRLSSTALLLGGAAVAACTGAAAHVLALAFDPNQLRFVTSWMVGSPAGKGLDGALLLTAALPVALVVALRLGRELDVLQLGEELAARLGSPIARVQGAAICLAATCAALAVGQVGNLALVGLIAGHAARALVGPHHRHGLPAAAAVGALVTVLADLIARTVLAPREIPTGALLGLIGGPLLIALLLRRYR